MFVQLSDSSTVRLTSVQSPYNRNLVLQLTIRSMNRKDSKTVAIIAMTANAYDEDVQKCLKAGMNAHLAKPIDPETMYQVIAEHLK